MDEVVLGRIVEEVLASPKIGAEHRAVVAQCAKRVLVEALDRCHREDVPLGLELLLAEMVEARLKLDGAVPGLAGTAEVASITRGDTAISYRDKGAGDKAADAFFKDYATRLRPYKKMNLPKGG